MDGYIRDFNIFEIDTNDVTDIEHLEQYFNPLIKKITKINSQFSTLTYEVSKIETFIDELSNYVKTATKSDIEIFIGGIHINLLSDY